MKQSKWSRIISITVILLSVGMVLYLILSSGEIGGIVDALAASNKGWLVAAILCYAGYVLAEGVGLFAFLRVEGYRIKMFTAAHISFTGMFYANLTPSSTGGQPMQIYEMTRRKILGSVATSALTVRYFFNQVALVGMLALLWWINADFIASQEGIPPALVIFGFVLNFASLPLIGAIVIWPGIVERIALWGIRLLTRCHVIKNPDKWVEKAKGGIENFHSSLMTTLKSPLHVLIQLVVSVVEMTMLMLVPLMVYLALHESMSAHTPALQWHQLVTVAYMLYSAVAFFPLPGATGAQEVGFKSYFKGIFLGNGVQSAELNLSLGLMLWRFATFYLCLLAGCVDTVITNLRSRHEAIEHVERIDT